MRRTIIVVVSLLATSACSTTDPATIGLADPKPSSGDERVITDEQRATVAPTRVDVARLEVAEQEPYGAFLVDASGYPLYSFSADTPSLRSACHEDCARAWPPILSAGTPQVGDPRIQPSMLGSIARDGTERHATYNGWPLYLYAGDQPGQVRGHGVQSFGGQWLLLGPDGAPLGEVEVQARR